jgi:hypothetical protein
MIDDTDMEVRWERLSELTAISDGNREAFGGSTEADLVEELRTKAGCISLVAASKQTVVGHILFTPVELTGSSATVQVGRGVGPGRCGRRGSARGSARDWSAKGSRNGGVRGTRRW